MGREYPTQPVVAVGGVVVRDGCVLLVERGQAPARGRWTLPGGVLELGEALREGVQRELREECGIEVEVGELLGAFDRVLRDDAGRVVYHYVILDYAARWLAGEPRAGSDAARLRWVPLDEVEDPVLADLARRAARATYGDCGCGATR